MSTQWELAFLLLLIIFYSALAFQVQVCLRAISRHLYNSPSSLLRSGDFAFRHVPSHSASHYKACCRMGIFNFKSFMLKTACLPAMQTMLAVSCAATKQEVTYSQSQAYSLAQLCSSSSSWHCIVLLSLLSLSGTTLRDANGNEDEERRRLWSRVRSKLTSPYHTRIVLINPHY